MISVGQYVQFIVQRDDVYQDVFMILTIAMLTDKKPKTIVVLLKAMNDK